MSSLHNDVYDNGLNVIDTLVENLYILKADPGLVWANIATHGLGLKATPEISAPSDKDGGGREVTIAGITDGDVTATGEASYFALTDDSANKILASAPLGTTQEVTINNKFTLTELKVGIPGPA